MKLYPINELHTSGCFKTLYLKPVFVTGVGLIIKSNVKFKPYTENLEHSSNMDDDTTSTCTSRVHCWTDVAWWDQVRGCSKMLPYCPIPFIFLSDAPLPPPPLLGLSSELHVARLPTASCDKPSCPLTTSFLMLAGETRVVAASVCVRACARVHQNMHRHAHMHTHWVQGNIIQEEEEFPNDQTQAAWWVFASPRLCCLSVSISEVRHCISVYLSFPVFLLLCIDIYISVCLGCCFSLCLRSISMFFPPLFFFFLFYFL